MTFEDADVEDEQASAKILELFENCKALHRISYADSKLDFDKLNLTQRLKRQQRSTERGGYADVFMGSLNSGDKVAVKVLRFVYYSAKVEEEYKNTILRFFREMTLWYDLDHINIAHLLGFTLANGEIGLVSRWYTNGNVVNYLEMNPKASKPDLVLDVAEGIKFLHTRPNPLIHADLKGANILVAESGIACIGDFGISKRIDDMGRRTGFTTPSGVAGTPRWMAPELYYEVPLTLANDVYSFAWVIIEIYCPPKVPYHYIANDAQVIIAKHQGKLPDRTRYPELHDQDALWDIISACFSHDPQQRHDISSITEELYKAFALSPRPASSTSRRPKSNQLSGSPNGAEDPLSGDHTSPKTKSQNKQGVGASKKAAKQGTTSKSGTTHTTTSGTATSDETKPVLGPKIKIAPPQSKTNHGPVAKVAGAPGGSVPVVPSSRQPSIPVASAPRPSYASMASGQKISYAKVASSSHQPPQPQPASSTTSNSVISKPPEPSNNAEPRSTSDTPPAPTSARTEHLSQKLPIRDSLSPPSSGGELRASNLPTFGAQISEEPTPLSSYTDLGSSLNGHRPAIAEQEPPNKDPLPSTATTKSTSRPSNTASKPTLLTIQEASPSQSDSTAPPILSPAVGLRNDFIVQSPPTLDLPTQPATVTQPIINPPLVPTENPNQQAHTPPNLPSTQPTNRKDRRYPPANGTIIGRQQNQDLGTSGPPIERELQNIPAQVTPTSPSPPAHSPTSQPPNRRQRANENPPAPPLSLQESSQHLGNDGNAQPDHTEASVLREPMRQRPHKMPDPPQPPRLHTPEILVPPEPGPQAVQSPPSTETVLYRELKSHWVNWLDGQNQAVTWCDEHTIMAKAEALYEWDGIIPKCRTPGLPLAKGKSIQICNIINKYWCQAHHQGKCEYVPRQFVNINQPLDERAKRLIGAYPNPPPPPVIQPPAPEPEPSFFAQLCCGAKKPSDKPIALVDPNASRPQVPPAPFDGEPSDFGRNNNRVLTHAKCEGFKTGSIVKCFITLIPAAHRRFTRLKFAAELQSGHIVGLFPQKIAGGPAAVMRGQGAEATIKGDGVDSGKVTWDVKENAAVSSGLPSRLELSILLPTPSPPPRLTCSCEVRLEHETQSDAEERFDHKWDFNFTLNPQSRSYG